MDFEISSEAKTIKIYNLHADTKEFIGAGDAYIPPHTGLPALCTTTAPPEILVDHVAVFNVQEQIWVQVEDHRGETVYDKTTGNAILITKIGSLSSNEVCIAPNGKYEKWNGKVWVKDKVAEKNAHIIEAKTQKNNMLMIAHSMVATLEDAVELEIATDEETSKLPVWKKYRVLINRVDISTAPDIDWPTVPGV
ncbi:MAG: tail fiber assembly protein [Candidatus Symbiopectobacterium sp. Dall1.0]|nr:tail fiber assembly protein [Candidatus Symbiopectobacterium sp. Dall1.0]